MGQIETDGLQIADVGGTKYRLAPLVVRGPERRAKAEEFSVGAPVEVILTGVLTDGGRGGDGERRIGNVSLDVISTLPGVVRPQLEVNGRAVMSIAPQSMSRIERRSGADRRKA